MKTLRIFFIMAMLMIGSIGYGQNDKLLSLLESAWNYNDSGYYQKSVEVWDEFLDEVRRTEGEDCEHFFMGMLYKAGSLIKMEKYQDAEIILQAASMPSTGADIKLTLTYLKSSGECASKLGKIADAYYMYKDAYDYLLKYKEYYVEETEENYHWCWSDELCSIALEIARLFRRNGEYENAEAAILNAFENMRQDSEICWQYSADGLYYLCLLELMEIYNETLAILVGDNDEEYILPVYDIAINVSKLHPQLITAISADVVDFVILALLKKDKHIAKMYINEYINLIHMSRENWCEKGYYESIEQYLLLNQFEYVKFGHLCKDFGDFDLALEYFRMAKSFLEDNNLKKTEDYLKVLNDISYVLELKHKSN